MILLILPKLICIIEKNLTLFLNKEQEEYLSLEKLKYQDVGHFNVIIIWVDILIYSILLLRYLNNNY